MKCEINEFIDGKWSVCSKPATMRATNSGGIAVGLCAKHAEQLIATGTTSPPKKELAC